MRLYKNSITEAIYARAAERPDAVALREDGGRTITYARLIEQADRMALNLMRKGLRKGDRALLLVRPGIDVMLLALALVRSGVCLVLADPGMGRETFETRVRLATPRWVFAETLLLVAQHIGPLRRALRARNVEMPDFATLDGARVVSVGPRFLFLGHAINIAELRRPVPGAPASLMPGENALCPADEAMIVFTSGTTGLPRGVVHTWGSVHATMEMISSEMAATRDDVVYASSLHLVMHALCAGALAILPPHHFDPEKYLRTLERHGVTLTFALPSELEEVMQHMVTERHLPATLTHLMLGSAPVPAGFLQRLSAILPEKCIVWDVYGMTEMLPICGVTLTEKLAYQGSGDLVGRPLAGVNVRLADDGELVVSGPNLFSHYLGVEGRPVSEHRTGDMAVIDEHGRLVLTGRKKDMIIKGAHNIYPSLFESTIERIEGVAACAMVGLYREQRSDEAIVLVVESMPGVDRVVLERDIRRELLHGPLSIDTYAQPDRIVFATLPRSGRSNKVDKKQLRRLLTDGLL